MTENCSPKCCRPHRERRDEARWCTSVHESGHAVMAYLVRLPFTHVTIRPAMGGVLGHMAADLVAYLRGEAECPFKDRRAALAAVLVAGCIAEEQLTTAAGRRCTSAESDYAVLDELFGGPDSPDEQKRGVVVFVEEAVREALRRPDILMAVMSVATELDNRVTLTQADVTRIISGYFTLPPTGSPE